MFSNQGTTPSTKYLISSSITSDSETKFESKIEIKEDASSLPFLIREKLGQTPPDYKAAVQYLKKAFENEQDLEACILEKLQFLIDNINHGQYDCLNELYDIFILEFKDQTNNLLIKDFIFQIYKLKTGVSLLKDDPMDITVKLYAEAVKHLTQLSDNTDITLEINTLKKMLREKQNAIKKLGIDNPEFKSLNHKKKELLKLLYLQSGTFAIFDKNSVSLEEANTSLKMLNDIMEKFEKLKKSLSENLKSLKNNFSIAQFVNLVLELEKNISFIALGQMKAIYYTMAIAKQANADDKEFTQLVNKGRQIMSELLLKVKVIPKEIHFASHFLWGELLSTAYKATKNTEYKTQANKAYNGANEVLEDTYIYTLKIAEVELTNYLENAEFHSEALFGHIENAIQAIESHSYTKTDFKGTDLEFHETFESTELLAELIETILHLLSIVKETNINSVYDLLCILIPVMQDLPDSIIDQDRLNPLFKTAYLLRIDIRVSQKEFKEIIEEDIPPLADILSPEEFKEIVEEEIPQLADILSPDKLAEITKAYPIGLFDTENFAIEEPEEDEHFSENCAELAFEFLDPHKPSNLKVALENIQLAYLSEENSAERELIIKSVVQRIMLIFSQEMGDYHYDKCISMAKSIFMAIEHLKERSIWIHDLIVNLYKFKSYAELFLDQPNFDQVNNDAGEAKRLKPTNNNEDYTRSTHFLYERIKKREQLLQPKETKKGEQKRSNQITEELYLNNIENKLITSHFKIATMKKFLASESADLKSLNKLVFIADMQFIECERLKDELKSVAESKYPKVKKYHQEINDLIKTTVINIVLTQSDLYTCLIINEEELIKNSKIREYVGSAQKGYETTSLRLKTEKSNTGLFCFTLMMGDMYRHAFNRTKNVEYYTLAYQNYRKLLELVPTAFIPQIMLLYLNLFSKGADRESARNMFETNAIHILNALNHINDKQKTFIITEDAYNLSSKAQLIQFLTLFFRDIVDFLGLSFHQKRFDFLQSITDKYIDCLKLVISKLKKLKFDIDSNHEIYGYLTSLIATQASLCKAQGNKSGLSKALNDLSDFMTPAQIKRIITQFNLVIEEKATATSTTTQSLPQTPSQNLAAKTNPSPDMKDSATSKSGSTKKDSKPAFIKKDPKNDIDTANEIIQRENVDDESILDAIYLYKKSLETFTNKSKKNRGDVSLKISRIETLLSLATCYKLIKEESNINTYLKPAAEILEGIKIVSKNEEESKRYEKCKVKLEDFQQKPEPQVETKENNAINSSTQPESITVSTTELLLTTPKAIENQNKTEIVDAKEDLPSSVSMEVSTPDLSTTDASSFTKSTSSQNKSSELINKTLLSPEMNKEMLTHIYSIIDKKTLIDLCALTESLKLLFDAELKFSGSFIAKLLFYRFNPQFAEIYEANDLDLFVTVSKNTNLHTPEYFNALREFLNLYKINGIKLFCTRDTVYRMNFSSESPAKSTKEKIKLSRFDVTVELPGYIPSDKLIPISEEIMSLSTTPLKSSGMSIKLSTDEDKENSESLLAKYYMVIPYKKGFTKLCFKHKNYILNDLGDPASQQLAKYLYRLNNSHSKMKNQMILNGLAVTGLSLHWQLYFLTYRHFLGLDITYEAIPCLNNNSFNNFNTVQNYFLSSLLNFYFDKKPYDSIKFSPRVYGENPETVGLRERAIGKDIMDLCKRLNFVTATENMTHILYVFLAKKLPQISNEPATIIEMELTYAKNLLLPKYKELDRVLSDKEIQQYANKMINPSLKIESIAENKPAPSSVKATHRPLSRLISSSRHPIYRSSPTSSSSITERSTVSKVYKDLVKK